MKLKVKNKSKKENTNLLPIGTKIMYDNPRYESMYKKIFFVIDHANGGMMIHADKNVKKKTGKTHGSYLVALNDNIKVVE